MVTYTKKQLPKIIKTILDDLNEQAESLITDEEIDAYIEKWVEDNLL